MEKEKKLLVVGLRLHQIDVNAYMCDICAKYIARMCNFAIQILTKR